MPILRALHPWTLCSTCSKLLLEGCKACMRAGLPKPTSIFDVYMEYFASYSSWQDLCQEAAHWQGKYKPTTLSGKSRMKLKSPLERHRATAPTLDSWY